MSDVMDFLKTPEGIGLLSAGFGGLAHARRGQPINAIGSAGVSGLLGYGNAQQRQDLLQNNAFLRDMHQAQTDAITAKTAKEGALLDMQMGAMKKAESLLNPQPVEAPRPLQGYVAEGREKMPGVGFSVDTPDKLTALQADYEKLLKVDPQAAAQVKEQLVQQGAIKPQQVQQAPDWQRLANYGALISSAGLKGGDQFLKLAEMQQPNIQYVDTGNGLIPYSKNGVAVPGAVSLQKNMSPKEVADTMRQNAELSYKTGIQLPVNGQSLGLQIPPNGMTPESQNAVVQKGRESLNDNWVKNTYQPTLDAGNSANAIIGQVQTLRNIPINTGWGTEAKAAGASVLAGLGIAPQNAELFASNAQKFQQVANERLWTVLNAAKGPQTEGDATRAKQTFVSLQNTPQANAFILDLAEATANRDRKKAAYYEEAQQLAQRDGNYTRVDQEWRKLQRSVWDDPIMQKWVRK